MQRKVFLVLLIAAFSAPMAFGEPKLPRPNFDQKTSVTRALPLQSWSTEELQREFANADLAVHHLLLRQQQAASSILFVPADSRNGILVQVRTLGDIIQKLIERRDALKREMDRRHVRPPNNLAERKLDITRQVLPKSGGPCSRCSGSGWIPCRSSNCSNGRYTGLNSDRKTCSTCNGAGRETCPRCGVLSQLFNNSRGSGIEP